MNEINLLNKSYMNKLEINIPDGIKYVSDIPNYSIPKGHVIVDKGICGCGYTHWCLTNNQPLILCSPRKLLLENKKYQLGGVVYYFENTKEAIVEYDKAGLDVIDNITNIDQVSADEKEKYLIQLKSQLFNYINTNSLTKVPKIMVTYDSLPHVLDVIKKFQRIDFQIVVDEFQSIFVDSQFKSTVELDFVEYLQDCPNVCYLSATPMLDKYLCEFDYFKDLPYYRLNWPKSMTTLIKVNRKFTNSLVSSCREIINSYKDGAFKKYVDPKGTVFESKEVVFFVNSVKVICDIISKCGLKAEECNIICAKTTYNYKKISKLGKQFDFGTVPGRNEPNKMFTFCTRTAYLGADFYSECASTVICSNINVKTLVLDISLDLPQIMGRQRLDSNPFKNECLLLYTGERKKDCEISYEELCERINNKTNESNALLDLYDRALDDQKLAYINKLKRDKSLYQFDYVGISKKTGLPVKNHLVIISELRAWEISRPEYQDTIVVRNELGDDYIIDDNSNQLNIDDIVLDLSRGLSQNNNFRQNMAKVCDFIDKYPNYYKENYQKLSIIIPTNLLNYINQLGVSKIKGLQYVESALKQELYNIGEFNKVKEEVQTIFNIGSNLLISDIKKHIQDIYDKHNIKKTAKATDILEWFEVRPAKLTINGKQQRSYQLINKK